MFFFFSRLLSFAFNYIRRILIGGFPYPIAYASGYQQVDQCLFLSLNYVQTS